MKIEVDIVIKSLNSLMESKRSIIRFERSKTTDSTLPVIDIVIKDDYIESFIINVNDNFKNDLKTYLKNDFGIDNIKFNNTGSCFWHEDMFEIKLRWRDVFDSSKLFPNNFWYCKDRAKSVGYKYILFNGLIYNVNAISADLEHSICKESDLTV